LSELVIEEGMHQSNLFFGGGVDDAHFR
jgi:hypothetical protein